MAEDWTTVQRHRASSASGASISSNSSYTSSSSTPPPTEQPTVHSSNKGIAWRITFQNTSSSTAKSKSNRRGVSSSSGFENRLKSRNSTEKNTNALNKRMNTSYSKVDKDMSSNSSSNNTNTNNTNSNYTTYTKDVEKEDNVPSFSFAAAARRGGAQKRNAPVATKMNSLGSGGKSRSVASAPTAAPMTTKQRKAAKAKEEAKAKERGRKLLLLLSSGNFPELAADDSVDGGAIVSAAATNRSIAANTTEIAWGSSNSVGSGSGSKSDSPSKKTDCGETRSRSLSAHAEPYDPSSSSPAASNKNNGKNRSAIHQKSSTLASSTTATSSRDTNEQKIIRQKLWGALFSNVNRTIDEVYVLCEYESDIFRTQEAIKLLQDWRMDFQALLESFQRQNEFSQSFNGIEDDPIHDSELDSRGGRTFSSGSVDRVRRLSSSSVKIEDDELTKQGGIAWNVKKTSPQHLASKGSSSGIRVALQQTISPPRGAKKSPNNTKRKQKGGDDSDEHDNIIRIEEFEASCSTDDQPILLNVVVEKHQSDKKLWADICDEEDEINGVDVVDEEDLERSSGSSNNSNHNNNIMSSLLETSIESIHSVSDHSVHNLESISEGEEANITGRSVTSNRGNSNTSSRRKSLRRHTSPPTSPGKHHHQEERKLHKSLHAKLSSPDRRKPSPLEAKRKLDEKQYLAQMNRERLDNERMAKLRKSTERLRHATERRQQRTKSTKMSMLKRLNESDSRREQQLREKAKKAGSENSKVEEVVFINTLQEENRKRTLSERLADGEARRAEIIGKRQQRQREHHAKVETAADIRRKKTLKEENRVRKIVEKKEQAAEERKLRREKQREMLILSRSRKEERVQKNKEMLKQSRQKKKEERQMKMWHKVGMNGKSSSHNNNDIFTTDEEDNVGIEGSLVSDAAGTINTPVRAGVDVMPCLVATSQSKTSPMTPPTSPTTRSLHSNRHSMHSALSVGSITGNETESDVEDIVTRRVVEGDSPGLRSPRKQFRAALLNGESIDVASNRYDAADGGSGGGHSENEPSANMTTTTKSKKKKRKRNKKSGSSSGGSKGGKNSNGKGKGVKKNRKGGKREDSDITSICASSSIAPSSNASIEQQKIMRKRMKKIKERMKKMNWRKKKSRGGGGGNARDGDEEEDEEEYDLTWEEGAIKALKKSRASLYTLHTEFSKGNNADSQAPDEETSYQSDCRLLKFILFSLLNKIKVTSNHVQLNKSDNGWNNLVQCGGIELLVRYVYQYSGEDENVDGNGETVYCNLDKRVRRTRTICLSLLETLVTFSSSAAYSLVSTGAMLIVLTEGTLAIKRELSPKGQYINDNDIQLFFTNLGGTSLLLMNIVLKWTNNDGSSLLEWPSSCVNHLVEYMVSTGMWLECSELLHQCAASKGGLLNDTRQLLLKRCLILMENTVTTLYNVIPTGDSDHDNVTPLPPLVHDAFASTGIQALLHLVEALAESQKVQDAKDNASSLGRRNTSQFNRHVASPIPFIGTTLQILHIMLKISTRNIDVLHAASSDTGTQNELYHIFAYLLEWCTSDNVNTITNHEQEMEADQILEQTIILIGYYARGSAERQQSLHWGSHPTPLQRLCNLPFQFFSLEKSKEILFPTLISICYQDERNRSVVEDEISTEMLHKFIQDRINNNDSINIKAFEKRFPKSMWNDALTFFQ